MPNPLALGDYQAYFQTLPPTVQQQLGDRWGDCGSPDSQDCLPIPGIQLGNLFIGIQPSRGYDLDPSLNYHAPDLEPTHAYLAFYHWVRSHFGAHAIVHVGKHGNLEWLPWQGRGALGHPAIPKLPWARCPISIPFIVNDPGEGSQAKRPRPRRVIIDHLTPPPHPAPNFTAPLQQLETLVDEYYEAQSLDPIAATCYPRSPPDPVPANPGFAGFGG